MRVFLIAGEASGDKLGAALMAGLRQLRPDVTFDGVGGEAMTAEGLTSRFDMSELSVMGILEVLPRYRQLKRRIAEMAQAVIDTAPDVLITIDSPDFCLRVARLVKAASPTRVVHYVAPAIWAWRPERAQRMVGVVDQLLALFPFEPPYWQDTGIRCDFVGHPVVTDPVPAPGDVAAFKAQRDLNGPVLCVLPGSRRGEVSRLADRFGAAVAGFAEHVPDLHVVLPVASGLADLMRDKTAHWPLSPVLIEGKLPKLAAFHAADIALAASGTVSLELAAAGTPMVVAYDMNWLSRRIVERKLLIDTVTLVNLVSETRAVPEFIGARCQPDLIADGLAQVWAAPDSQHEAMRLTMERLGAGGERPGLRAARAVLSGLRQGVAT